MLETIKIKCPAKINLTLEILGKRSDGFHDIQSVMQTINLYDYLTITIQDSEKLEINLSGTSEEIPYDEKNLVHKAIMLYFQDKCSNYKINAHIEKNIPIAAGLAGGSTDAAGALFGLNEILNYYTRNELHTLCAKLGSDLNFCLEGGCQLTKGRGEILTPLPYKEFDLTLIKPKNLGISAKEAYVKYSELSDKPNLNITQKFLNGEDIKNCLHNDLEIALLRDYEELQTINNAYPTSVMSGSGSTYFILEKDIKNKLDDTFWFKTNLKSTPVGIEKY